jgi:hypothetical protein
MRLFRHRDLDGCRCYVHNKAHWLSILLLYSDIALLCRYCFMVDHNGNNLTVWRLRKKLDLWSIIHHEEWQWTEEAPGLIRWRGGGYFRWWLLKLIVLLFCYHRTRSVKAADSASIETKLQIWTLSVAFRSILQLPLLFSALIRRDTLKRRRCVENRRAVLVLTVWSNLHIRQRGQLIAVLD